MKSKKCGSTCKACLICERKKQCCTCSHSGFHGCVTWTRPQFTKQELTAFKTYFDKGPVNLPTAQQAASRAKQKIEAYITPEENTKLCIAHSHATMVGESRREWDGVCKDIKKRLGI